MPGLLYEAQLPAGAARSVVRSRTNDTTSNRSNNNVDDDASDESSYGGDEASAVSVGRENEQVDALNEPMQSSLSSRKRPPPPVAFGRQNSNNLEAESNTPLTNQSRAVIPLAIARLYKLKLASGYGASLSSSLRRGRSSRRNKRDESSAINESPLLADASPEEFYQRNFTAAELTADVEIEFPRDGGWIEKVVDDRNGREKYNVFGRNGEWRRCLVVSRRGKVYEVSNDEDDDNDEESQYEESSSIRLGLVSTKSLITCCFFQTINFLTWSFGSMPLTTINRVISYFTVLWSPRQQFTVLRHLLLEFHALPSQD